MKTAWDEFVDEQLQDPEVRATYEEEVRLLTIGIELANSARSKD
jgi:hypothetical protein